MREQGQAASERGVRRARELELLEAEAARDAAGEADQLPDERLLRPPEEDGGSRASVGRARPDRSVHSLEREIARLETDRQARLRDEIESLEGELERTRAEHVRLQEAAAERRSVRWKRPRLRWRAREGRREAERAVEGRPCTGRRRPAPTSPS